MDRRAFLSSSVVAPAMMIAVAKPAIAADKTRPPEERLLEDLKGLEKWARVMRQEVEHAGAGPRLDRRVLPSIAPWFGQILGEMASLEQV